MTIGYVFVLFLIYLIFVSSQTPQEGYHGDFNRGNLLDFKAKYDIDHLEKGSEKDACLFAHNFIRNLHGVPPFHWHEQLGKHAQEWAAHLSTIGKIDHSDGFGIYQENIHLYHGLGRSIGIFDAIYSWYQTIKEYNFTTNVINDDNYYALMFVAMIWDDTTRIGCGIAQNYVTNKIFVVAQYAPEHTNHDPAYYRIHVKPPLRYALHKTIDSRKIFLPDIEEFKEKR